MIVRALARRLLLLVTLLSLALVPNLGYAQVPATEDRELKGLVEALPAVGRIGQWKVAGTTFLVDANTIFFGFGDSRPGIGRCVEVDLTTATPPVATEIKPDDDCGPGGEDEDLEWRGRVTAAPASGFIGNYTIGGVVFSATEATFFEGFGATPPTLNDCVEVEYILDGARKLATKIEPEDDCARPGVPGENHFARARVDARPEGARFGAWVIGGASFVAVEGVTVFGPAFGADVAKPAVGDCVAVRFRERDDVRTLLGVRAATCEGRDVVGGFEAHGWLNQKGAEVYLIGPDKGNAATSISYTVPVTAELKERFGPLTDTPPTCVKVHYGLDASNARVARQIESRPDFRCMASADEHEIYGVIKALPPRPHLGKWTVGTIEVMVTRATRLQDGPFLVGRQVKVEYISAGDGTLVALKIEGEGTADGGDDQRERGRGKAYGPIETVGPVPGEWTIGGQAYTVTAATRLRDGGTSFAPEACVEVHFLADAAGKRTALKIEREDGQCPVGERGRVFGFVDAMPSGTYSGTWTVGGVSYTANAQTEFEFEAGVGAPTVGSFVRVTYVIESGARIAKQIKTLVPPGMGDESLVGKLSIPAGTNSLAANATWQIGPVSILIADATLIQDGAKEVADGALVRVTGYRDAEGNFVATQVTAVTVQYMPIVVH